LWPAGAALELLASLLDILSQNRASLSNAAPFNDRVKNFMVTI
jgi:hypothetical protein